MSRKKSGGGHHGGAWKVAYADFVTAMMALFMVLWICSQDEEILKATSRYFQNPFDSPLSKHSGVLPFESNRPDKAQGDGGVGSDQPESKSSQVEVDLNFLRSLAREFYRMLHLDENLEDRPIDVQVTADGLRVVLFDRSRQPLFKAQTAEFTEWGLFAMQSLAWMIDRHRFHVVIDGHTRQGLEMPEDNYGAWELSADRANASRRALTYYAVDTRLIERVTGYADTRPLPFQSPESESNQRVALSLTLNRQPASPAKLAQTSP